LLLWRFALLLTPVEVQTLSERTGGSGDRTLWTHSAACRLSPALWSRRPGPPRASVPSWNDVAWKDMAAAEQAAWKTLGWRSETWGSDDPAVEPEITQKEWSELTDGEKQTAAMLGYSQLNWNVEPDPCEAKRPLTKRKRRTASLPSTKAGFRSKAVDLVCPLDALNCVTTKAGELSSPQ
jgi:hypothetical protein